MENTEKAVTLDETKDWRILPPLAFFAGYMETSTQSQFDRYIPLEGWDLTGLGPYESMQIVQASHNGEEALLLARIHIVGDMIEEVGGRVFAVCASDPRLDDPLAEARCLAAYQRVPGSQIVTRIRGYENIPLSAQRGSFSGAISVADPEIPHSGNLGVLRTHLAAERPLVFGNADLNLGHQMYVCKRRALDASFGHTATIDGEEMPIRPVSDVVFGSGLKPWAAVRAQLQEERRFVSVQAEPSLWERICSAFPFRRV